MSFLQLGDYFELVQLWRGCGAAMQCGIADPFCARKNERDVSIFKRNNKVFGMDKHWRMLQQSTVLALESSLVECLEHDLGLPSVSANLIFSVYNSYVLNRPIIHLFLESATFILSVLNISSHFVRLFFSETQRLLNIRMLSK